MPEITYDQMVTLREALVVGQGIVEALDLVDRFRKPNHRYSPSGATRAFAAALTTLEEIAEEAAEPTEGDA